ncbi:MAG: VUT family protein [Abditibacteriota bacterium]|nr:VUT family protein [Abditibacteriota bacterium]
MNSAETSRASFDSLIILDRKEADILLRCIPATVTALFVVSVICMNLLANKTLVQTPWIALDGGILISWLSFLCMDIITKYFGPKASNTIAVLAVSINLATCLIFYVAGAIPSRVSDYSALDGILKGTWFILLGSTIAFLASAVINNFMNWQIGRLFRKDPDGRAAFYARTYISTFIGQFLDNFIFAIIVFVIFAPIFWDGFHWTPLQCAVCSLTGAAAELIMEMLFAPMGYRIVAKWKKHNVGAEYLEYMEKGKEIC